MQEEQDTKEREPEERGPEERGGDTTRDPIEILTFTLMGGYSAAVINKEVDKKAANIGGRYQTQMVLATSIDTLNQRVNSTLIAEFGMTPEEAEEAIASGMTELTVVEPPPEPDPEDMPFGG